MTYGGETAGIVKYLWESNLNEITSAGVQLRIRVKCTPHSLFHSSRSSLRYCIPELWCTEMNVIDTEEIHIFDVPCKSSPPHSKVEVRSIHSWKTLVGRRQ